MGVTEWDNTSKAFGAVSGLPECAQKQELWLTLRVLVPWQAQVGLCGGCGGGERMIDDGVLSEKGAWEQEFHITFCGPSSALPQGRGLIEGSP